MAAGKTTFWVARLAISSATRDKIIDEHHIEEREIRDAIVTVRGLVGTWAPDRKGTMRLLAQVVIRGRPSLVSIYPRWDTSNPDDPWRDDWNLGSVYFL